METVIFHPAARAELLDASIYYEGCRAGLGQHFLAAVETAVNLARMHPEAGSGILLPYRRFLVQQFPYGIVCRRSGTVVYVVAVMHLRRKPGCWHSRTGI